MLIIEQNVRRVLEIAETSTSSTKRRLEYEGETESLRNEEDIMEMYIGERHK